MGDIRKLQDQIKPSSTNDGDGSYGGCSSGALLTAYSNIRTCHCDTDDRCAMYKQSRKAFSIQAQNNPGHERTRKDGS